MLDWSGDSDIVWGWKYTLFGDGNLYYQAERTGYTPLFPTSVKLWEFPVDFDAISTPEVISIPEENYNEFPANQIRRISFVRRGVLLEHPSWKFTPASRAYAEAVHTLTEKIG